MPKSALFPLISGSNSLSPGSNNDQQASCNIIFKNHKRTKETGRLVLIEKEYIRCPNCGGFLPWQSWQRFFSG
nr:hypothetical protein CTI12_AA327260 [Tanacetum cinerariifolium]